MKIFKIDGEQIYPPNDFKMVVVKNLIESVTLYNGSKQYDYSGYRYGDSTWQWGGLPEGHLNILLRAAQNSEFILTFEDALEGVREIKCCCISRVAAKHRITKNGKPFWKNIEVEVTFPDAYK